MLKIITVEILVISYPVYKYVCTSDDVVNVHVQVFHNSYFQYSWTSLPPARYNLNGCENNITDTFGKCVRLRRLSMRYNPTSLVVTISYWSYPRASVKKNKYNNKYSSRQIITILLIELTKGQEHNPTVTRLI